MSTLTQPTLSALIDRLFAEADAAEKERWPATRGSDSSDYRQYYGLLKDQPLPVSRATGRLIYMLARSAQARTIVEFGTSFGISTLHLAAALRDNGGGRLIGSEFEPSKIARALANLGAAGLSDLVEIREGDALQTLARDLPDLIDFVLLDGAKVSIRLSSRCLRVACGPGLSSSPTTRMIARNTLPACGLWSAIIFQFRSPMMSNYPCGWRLPVQ